MRNHSGWAGSGPVTLADHRATELTLLLQDFARPGLCLILGAGASYGVVPMTKADIEQAIRELRQAKGNLALLPSRHQEVLTDPVVGWVVARLPQVGDRFLDEVMPLINYYRSAPHGYLGSAAASVIVNEVFTPRRETPAELTEIYGVLESTNGVIVTYNYDRIEGEAHGFRVIAPHGQRSRYSVTPAVWRDAQTIALQSGVPIPTDIHLPLPEHEGVRDRPAYGEMVRAWCLARCVVLIGYGFGAGADEMSFYDFGRSIGPKTIVHVVNPESKDLTRQVGFALKNRGRSERVLGHSFRWQPLAAAILEVLDRLNARNVRWAVPYSAEICSLHDRGCAPRKARIAPRSLKDVRDEIYGRSPIYDASGHEIDPEGIREGEDPVDHFYRTQLRQRAERRRRMGAEEEFELEFQRSRIRSVSTDDSFSRSSPYSIRR
jgi:hypothetical protein